MATVNDTLNTLQSEKVREDLQKETDQVLKRVFAENKECLKAEMLHCLKAQCQQLGHKLTSLSTLTNFQQKVKGQFNKIRTNCAHKFEPFLVTESLKMEMVGEMESYVSGFWETMVCDLVRKWSEEAGRWEHSLE